MTQDTNRTYWVQVFTPRTWQRFMDRGGTITGFRETRWNYIQTLRPGDYLLCYLSGVSKWVGAMEVQGEPYLDTTKIWDEALFPCRAKVRIIASLSLDMAVPIQDLKDRLSIFRARNWGLYLISSPLKWKRSDGEAVLEAIVQAQRETRQ